MEVLFKARVKKDLKKVPAYVAERFKKLVKELKVNLIPARKFDVKKLKGFEHTFRVRIGGYRVIYEVCVEDGLIIIHGILPREKAYK